MGTTPRSRCWRPAYAGILQANAYGGFYELYRADRRPDPIAEAAC